MSWHWASQDTLRRTVQASVSWWRDNQNVVYSGSGVWFGVRKQWSVGVLSAFSEEMTARNMAKWKEAGTEDAHYTTPGQAHLDTVRLVGTGGWWTGGKGELVSLGAVSLSGKDEVLELHSNNGYTTLYLPNATSWSRKWEKSLETF